MARKNFTDETSVNEFIAAEYAGEGVVPSVAVIREHFGGGSFSTYQRIREAWIKTQLKNYPEVLTVKAVINEDSMKQLLNVATSIFNRSIGQIISQENDKMARVVSEAETDTTEVIMKLQEKEDEIKKLEAKLIEKDLDIKQLNEELGKRAEQAAEERGVLKEKITSLEKQNIALQSELRITKLNNQSNVEKPNEQTVKEKEKKVRPTA